MTPDSEPDGQGALRLHLLGGLSITQGGVPVRGFLSSKVQALLCYLAVTGRAHARESLMTLLWGEMAEERAAHGLRQALSNLQKLVGPTPLVITRQTVAFNTAAPHDLDTEAFLTLLKQAESASIGVHRRLRQAVGLYTGDFLDGFYVRDVPDFNEWAAAQREYLRHQALDALHKLATYHAARGDYPTAAGHLQQLLALDPWREDAHRQLMLVLVYQGQPDAAIAQYQRCRRVIAEEFGEEPSVETTTLYRRIRAGEIVPPPRPVPPGNLPTPIEPLIGRSAELAEVAALLEDPATRLLTLTGSGGVGKTRFALQIAREMAGDFEQGVFFVPLAAVRDPALVLRTIAGALGVEAPTERPPEQTLQIALRDKHLLLVLDNFEQLLAAAPQVTGLIGDLPRLRVLLTSRARLRVRGERVYEVVPLALPPLHDPAFAEVVGSFPAARLFAERACAARPDFAITDANARVVAEICHRLEGLPLALELAAARLNIMSAQVLLARLGNRLGLLTGGARDLPERQQTVKATIAWSYELLSPQEKDLFARLSVFVGGCTLDAIEAICYADADGTADPLHEGDRLLEPLTALVNSSLVRREPAPGGEERFRMLELVREYALFCLAEKGEGADGETAIRRRHTEHYLNLVLRARSELLGPRQIEWMARFEIEYGNLRAALGWARDHPAPVPNPSPTPAAPLIGPLALALSAGATLVRFWQSYGYVSEGRQWLDGLLARPEPVAPAIRANALRSAGSLAFAEGAAERAVSLCEEGLALYTEADDDLERAALLNSLGNAKRELGAYSEAIALYEQALAIFRRLEDTVGISIIYNNLGATAHRQAEYGRAITLYEEGLALRRAVDDPLGIAYALYKLAEVARDQGDFGKAVAACEESLVVSQRSGDKNGVVMAVLTMGTVRQAQGDDRAAEVLFDESLTRFTETADRWGIATVKHRLGLLAHSRGDDQQAHALYQESLNLSRENGDKRAETAVLADLRQLAKAGRAPDRHS